MTRRLLALLCSLALLLAACGDDDASDDAGGDTAATTDDAGAGGDEVDDADGGETDGDGGDDTADDAAEGGDAGGAGTDGAGEAATVEVADGDLGEVLVDADGMTLYLFTSDSEDSSSCSDVCADTWPPLTGDAVAGDGIDAEALSTFERDDGTTQLSYHGHPLYLFAGDTAPGDTEGHGLTDSWFAVTPDGEQAG
jgi:predicted lipoprotein with Yx(FWY)xxD motif